MKPSKAPYIIIAIGFIAYNLLSFVIPSEKTGAFWTTYVFGIISFGIVAFAWKRAIDNGKDFISRYYKIPLVQLGFAYVIISVVLMLIFKFVTIAQVWTAVLICALLLCIVCIGFITTDSAIEAGIQEIERIEQNISKKRSYIKNLQIEVEMLAEKETDAEIKKKLTILAKKIRLSDPMSDDSVSDLEQNLIDRVSAYDMSSDKTAAIEEIEQILLKRNKKIKALKG
ncbi:MAG: hypothetical protein K2N27_03270 [Ruminococcus sp.]|nr:hypothetical protein [Ruminococcus sp.]